MVTAEDFAERRAQVTEAGSAVDIELSDAQNKLVEASVAKQQLEAGAKELNTELLSLQQRKSSIPKRQLDLRGMLCRELRLDEDTLPFAGELIAVREEESDWEGAAERLLHSFALAILVPGEHYRAVSDWINGHHLDMRVVYYQVPATAMKNRAAPPSLGQTTLAAKLEVKDTPFAAWLERELATRADLECVETMAQFRRATRAITKAGQVKSGTRHEKDDRSRIGDRSRYVLGWSNERKIEALLAQARARRAAGGCRAGAWRSRRGREVRPVAEPDARGARADARVLRDRLPVGGEPDRRATGGAREAEGSVGDARQADRGP